MTRYKKIDGIKVPLTLAEESARDIEESAWAAAADDRLAAAISAEAERRLLLGTLITGIPFKTDDGSMTRLQGLVTRAERSEAAAGTVSDKFRTASGTVVTVTTAAQAQAFFDAAADHIAFILGRSAELQVAALAGELGEDFDPMLDAHWE